MARRRGSAAPGSAEPAMTQASQSSRCSLALARSAAIGGCARRSARRRDKLSLCPDIMPKDDSVARRSDMSQPRYRQLADSLKADIVAGRYPVGSQLPPEYELCELHDVSRHTARDALRLLLEEGLVERRRGVGTTVLRTRGSPAFVQPL